MQPRLYTVTEIAEEICRADRLQLSDHATAHSQVRNAVRRGMLKSGRQVDKRGTQAFPAIEIYRARILNALADLSMDISAISEPLQAAFDDTQPIQLPARCDVGGAFIWRGFADVVRGPAAGEQWHLIFKLFKPGYTEGKRLQARFVWVDAPDAKKTIEAETFVEGVKGTGSPHVTVTLNLNDLFAGLPALEDA